MPLSGKDSLNFLFMGASTALIAHGALARNAEGANSYMRLHPFFMAIAFSLMISLGFWMWRGIVFLFCQTDVYIFGRFFEICYIPLNRHIWKAVYCIHFARPIMFWYLYLISGCRLSFWTNICKNFVLISYWNLFWPEFPFTWSLSQSFSNLRNCATWFLVFPTWQRHVSVPWVW